MKKFAYIIASIFCLQAQAQIVTNINAPYDNANYLVNNVLLGTGIVSSNISWQSDTGQIGFFNGVTNLGIDSGIVMSTGHIDVLDTGWASSPFWGSNTVTDPDLLTVANSVPPLIGQTFSVSSINDVAVLEFDFIPTSDTVSFRYVFGSDEYLTWVNSTYNDVFGFFISGPGITGPYAAPAAFPNGSVNIAVVPNSTPALPITISSVNNVLNSTYYIDNQTVGNGTVDVNGFTTVFTAVAEVQCGETYHIRLAIADGSDQALSSYVFLEGGSFSSPSLDVSNSLNVDSTNTLTIPCYATVDLTANSQTNPDILWSTGDTTNTITVGPGSYWAEATDSLNCSIFSDTIHVVLPSLPMVNIGPDQTVCVNNTTDVTATVVGGSAPFTYLWSDGSTGSSINVGEGSYSVVVTDSSNCDSQDDADILEEMMPNAGLDGSITLCDDAPSFLLNTILGGTPDANGSWFNSSNASVSSIFYPNTDPTDILTYVSYGTVCPNDSAQVNVTIHQMPTPYAGPDTAICGAKYEMIGIPSVGTSVWTTDANVDFSDGSEDAQLTAHEYGIHTFTWTETNFGCVASDEVIIEFIDPPFQLNLTPNSYSLCPGDSITLDIGDNYDTYLWYRNDIPLVNSGSRYYTVCEEGDYKILVTTGICSGISPPAHITVKPLYDPSILDQIDSVICPVHPPIQLHAATDMGTWIGKGMNQYGVFNPAEAGVGDHWIKYVLDFNCNESDSILLDLGCDLQIFVPSAFTPNSDEHNELFTLASQYLISFEMSIFDRWGELMFHTKDIDHRWDGTFNGQIVPIGTYSYHYTAFGMDNQTVNKSGTITILK
jgi:gliding motility-associated-like protein